MKRLLWIAAWLLTAVPTPTLAQLELAAPRDVVRVHADGSEEAFTSLAGLETYVRGLAGVAPGEDLLAVPVVRNGRTGILIVGGDAQEIGRLRASLTAPPPPPTSRPARTPPPSTAQPVSVRDVLAPLREIETGSTSASEAVALFAARYNRAVAADPDTDLSRKVSRLLRLSAPKAERR